MNRMLDDPETTFFDKVEGFNQLAIMEMFLNHAAGQKQHLQAMWHYIEAHGGCSRFLSREQTHRGTLGIGMYSGNFVYVDMPLLTKIDLDIGVSRFISSLRRARLWYQLRWSCSQHNQITTSTWNPSWRPVNFRIYLDWLIGECLKKQDAPRHSAAGVFHSIYNIFMTPVIFNYGSRDSILFLQHIDTCMQQRPAANRELKDVPELVPVAYIFQGTSSMLFYVRNLISSEREDLEVELCQNSMDSLKVLPLLSGSSVLRLARDMIRCTLLPLNSHSHTADSFDEDYLQDLCWEAEKTWQSKSHVHETDPPKSQIVS